MFCDYHVHTSFSPDSHYPMKDCIEDAISLGINEICFTEHIDYGCINPFCCNHAEYYKTFLKYKDLYKNKITLKFGMEFGVQQHHKQYFEKIFEQYPFDFILFSLHQVEDKELWNQEFQSGKSQDEYYKIYYDEMLKTCKSFDNFSVIGHMDLLKRYEIYEDYPFEKNKPQIEEIFDYIISHNKGIEINTSSFRYGLSDFTPSKYIIKLYKNMGGEIVTIGSDSHCKSQLGSNIMFMKDYLKTLGFKYFTTYEKMKPIFNKL